MPLNEIANLIQVNTQRNVEAFPLMLPHDLSDLFAASGWRRPEIYLKPEVRAGISAFAFSDQNFIEQGVQKLMKDLSNGEWDKKYGDILNLQEVDIGYRFLRANWEKETIVFGASQPGYADNQVYDWIKFLKSQGIKRVCCLLREKQIANYDHFLDIYRP